MPTKHTAPPKHYIPPAHWASKVNYDKGWDDGIAHERDRVIRVIREAAIKGLSPGHLIQEILKGEF